MENSAYLAGMHRNLVSDFIEAGVDQWAWESGPLEQNLLAGVLRSELESQLAPGLNSVLALLMEADAQMLGLGLPEWLDLTSSVSPRRRGSCRKWAGGWTRLGLCCWSRALGCCPGSRWRPGPSWAICGRCRRRSGLPERSMLGSLAS